MTMFLPLLFHRNPTFELSLFLRPHLERLPISRKIDNGIVDHVKPILESQNNIQILHPLRNRREDDAKLP